MFGRTADYALRALLFLTREAADGRYVGASAVARATGMPRNYTAKVLNALAKARLVTSTRGPTGGFRLAANPATITVGTLVDLFVDARPSGRCLLGDRQCNPSRPCAAHDRWSAVLDAQRKPLDATTIADLAHAAAPRPGSRSSTLAPTPRRRFHAPR
ncbi:MAG TPA: Rrf2 family transcriptional regulator [Gemmatimonadaceae bacterium]|nr:Rrf2 family transcriptional regulator [Gemmatimonadaceae bacterium]